ncbi:MAG: HNH endonuclease signature motif containing protein [Patescibacteria group bacterium]|nr:HNH endonuclease signature motif containing protein [Patescibacteria group bacterium]MDD5294755.1 HNH endonuclease signature motif containing protein [Patescibacteria group bacterium]MDD5554696.1 HNH endonuclease signature motif containing protein [Patescibacteria group bacterium]
MAFSDEVIKKAWQNAEGRCEKCNKTLRWESQGSDGLLGWEAHHKHSIAAGGLDVLSNCEILCQSCHKNTSTYGR